MIEDDIVPYVDGSADDARTEQLISRVSARSPRSIMGDDLLYALARELDDWRKDDRLPEVTPARLAFRLRAIVNIGKDMIGGWIKEPHGEGLRDPRRRMVAIRKLQSALNHVRKAAEVLEDETVLAYSDERSSDLAAIITTLELDIAGLRQERGHKGLTEALRLPVGALAEIGESLCGRTLRNVDRVEGTETGPFFRFAFDLIHRLMPEIPEPELSSSIRTLMREPKS